MENKLKTLILIMFFFIMISCSGFPTEKGINEKLLLIEQTTEPVTKKEILFSLLNSVRNPDSKKDGAIINYLIKSLAGTYIKAHDEVLIVTISEFNTNGELAIKLCELFEKVIVEKEFGHTYKNNSSVQQALQSCVGITLAQSDIDKLNK